MNLHELFAIPLRRNPQQIVFQYYATETDESVDVPFDIREITYAELYEAVDRLAAGLQQWGLEKGDRVAFYLSSRPELAIAYLAVIRLGAIMVPINLRYRRREIAHILEDCTPRLLISEKEHFDILQDAGVEESTVEATLWIEEADTWGKDAQSLAATPVSSEDLALIMYTSGTTGQSKGAMISHNNVIATVTALMAAWAWEPQDRLLLCLPLFHTHGFIVGMHCALAAGATILLRSRFDPAAIVADLVEARPTLFFAVPTIYVRLVSELQKLPRYDFSHMRLFCSGSAPLAPETFHAMQELTGHTILERYGMTETGMNFSNPYAGPRVPGSVGTPLPGVFMRIVDDALEDASPGDEGELLLRGSNVFSGYWLAPEKTAESFSHDALGQQWFHTGDLARQDPETGYVTLLGRRHELIISGGFNIYPREIEELLVTIPGVEEAAVVGVPHEEWGEVPVAYIVCQSVIEDDEITTYCRSQLASFKAPRKFVRVEQLPRNAMGKLQKHLL